MNSFEDRLNIVKGSLSGREFAAKLGMSPSTVNQYLTGARKPSIELVVLVCERFAQDPWWLMTGSHNKPDAYMIKDDLLIVMEAKIVEPQIMKDWEKVLKRIIREGDRKKIRAVQAQLDALDPDTE